MCTLYKTAAGGKLSAHFGNFYNKRYEHEKRRMYRGTYAYNRHNDLRLYKLDDAHLSCVAATGASLYNAGVTAVSLGKKTVSRASEISEGDKIKLRFTDGVIDCVAGKRDDL